MTTRAQIDANRKNGRRSTGPRTVRGRATSKMNAVTHGLRSLVPVLPGERAKDWTDHRAGIVAALVPVGALESELAERVALLTWRLRRVVRYESAVTSAGIDTAVARVRGEGDEDDPVDVPHRSPRDRPQTCATVRKELEEARGMARARAEIRDRLRQLPDLPAGQPIEGGNAFALLWELGAYAPTGCGDPTDIEDVEFLAAIGVPAEWRADADWWTGWTVGMVRAGVGIIARDNGLTESELIEWAVKKADRDAGREERKAMKLEPLLDYLTEQIAGAEQVARGRALLPDADVADKVMRYESHLNKQLIQTLHQLERLQAIRSGNPPVPPAALDVTVDTGGPCLDCTERSKGS
jgi:hypothetical protein